MSTFIDKKILVCYNLQDTHTMASAFDRQVLSRAFVMKGY